MARPLILVTNDDGIDSPGLRAAVAAVRSLGDLIIAAPRRQQTMAGRSMPVSFSGRVFEDVVEVNGERMPAFAMEGSPAQVVQHAIVALTSRLPDLAVSGINYGENLGTGITVSGTVGAALEAASLGVTGLAVSLGMHKKYHHSHSMEMDFDAAAHFAAHFAGLLLNRQLPFDVDVLKLDLPASATANTPWRLTRVSHYRYFVPVPPQDAVDSAPGIIDYEQSRDLDLFEPDSDVYAFAVDKVVSVSPVSLDMTSRVELAQVERLLRSNSNSPETSGGA